MYVRANVADDHGYSEGLGFEKPAPPGGELAQGLRGDRTPRMAAINFGF